MSDAGFPAKAAFVIPNPKARLLDQVREVLRVKHYALRTEEAYIHWITRFLRFHRDRNGKWTHPREMGAAEIMMFLSHLASAQHVAAATQNQALNALHFLYLQVLHFEPGDFSQFVRASKPRRIPVVLSAEEVRRLLAALEGTPRLMAQLFYGTGLRLMELLRLRIKDLDFDRNQIIVRGGKGNKDRATVFPQILKAALRAHLERVRTMFENDRRAELAGVWLPKALAVKYPRAAREWLWQWVFPSTELSVDPQEPRALKKRLMVES